MSATSCAGCRNTDASMFFIPFTMAFQPIVDVTTNAIWGYEALVRGVAGEGACQVLGQVTEQNRYAFDQACRVKAIELAGARIADSKAKLSINFMPNAVYEPSRCLRTTLEAALLTGFPVERIIFESTENERVEDAAKLERRVSLKSI